MLETDQRRQDSAKAVTGSDDVRIGVELSNFLVQFERGGIISIWLFQLVLDTRLITGVCSSLAVAHLAPEIRTALTAAA